MIDPDLSRLYQEKLHQALNALVSPHTGMLATSSSWHPHAQSDLVPLAENFAWALVLCRSKSTESILQARALLKRLLKWQRTLFPRYLHDLETTTCPHASLRIRFVMIALLKWHRLALGELASELESALALLETKLDWSFALEDRSLSSSVHGVYHARDLFDFFRAHLEAGALESSWSRQFFPTQVSWGEPLWLEKPWGSIETPTSLLEIAQLLASGKCPQEVGVHQLWTVLIHEGASLKELEPLEDEASRFWHATFRNFAHASAKRGKPHACCLHLQTRSMHRLTLYSELAAVKITAQEPDTFEVTLSYDPLQYEASGDMPNLFTLLMQGTDPWLQPLTAAHGAVAKMWSSASIEQLLQAPIRHQASGIEFQLIACTQKGYLHQGLYRRELLAIDLPLSCRGLTLMPLDPSQALEITFKLYRGPVETAIV